MKTINVVAAIIYNKNNEIFIAKRKHNKFNNLWEFPGGKIEENETHQQALVREINEEFDIQIKVGKLFTTVNFQYTDFMLKMNVYNCKYLNGNIKLNVHSEYKWINNYKELNNYQWVPADIDVVKKLIKT